MNSGRGKRGLGIALGILLVALWCVRGLWSEAPPEPPSASTSPARPSSRSVVESVGPPSTEIAIDRPNFEREARSPDDRLLTGRVVDRRGVPLPGARVEAFFRAMPPEDLDLGSCEVDEPRILATVVCDSVGRFVIHEVPWFGQIHFTIALAGYVGFDSSESPTMVPSEPSLDVGDFVLDSALAVAIQVVDDRQRPIEGAVVSSFLSLDRFTARTDANGRCVLDRLTAEPHAFFAQADGYAPAFAEPNVVELVVGSAAMSFTIVLARPGSVRGRVVDQTGRPIEGALVVAERNFRVEIEHPGASRWVKVARAYSGGDGSFDIAAICDGPAMLRAYIGNDISSMQLVWNGDTPVNLVIDRSRWLEIEVVDHETGLRLVPDYLLVFGAERGNSSRWIISDAGAPQIATAISEDRLIRSSWSEIRVDDLDGYGVAADVVGYQEGSSDLHPFPIVNGQRIRVDVQRGRVVSGTTFPGAEVTWIEFPRGARRGRVVLADKAGRFRLERASLRECELRARVPHSDPRVRTIPEDSKGADVEIDLR